MMRRRCALVLAAALLLTAARGHAVDAAPEVHGVADAYAVPGVALAWGILRGPGDAASVVIRISTDPRRYAFVAVEGVDPFTQKRAPMLSPTAFTGNIDVREPRARFADFPRTELFFFTDESAVRAGTPSLVVFYLGVPDTTPEFEAEAKLDAYLGDRLARLAATKERSP
jgi:hypothetical protein